MTRHHNASLSEKNLKKKPDVGLPKRSQLKQTKNSQVEINRMMSKCQNVNMRLCIMMLRCVASPDDDERSNFSRMREKQRRIVTLYCDCRACRFSLFEVGLKNSLRVRVVSLDYMDKRDVCVGVGPPTTSNTPLRRTVGLLRTGRRRPSLTLQG